jgi:hypothetical protein
MKSIIYTIITVILLMAPIASRCQNNDSESREAYKQRKQKEECDKYILTEDKINRLLEIGIDLRQGKGASPEILRSIFTDAVVVVRIVAVLDWPGPREQLFHTRVKASIKEVLKGKAIIGDTIEILQKSGPITDSGEADHIAYSTDCGFYVGEETIVLLRKMNKISNLKSKYNKKGYDLGNYEYDSTRFYVNQSLNIAIGNGKCMIDGKMTDVSQFKSDLKKIVSKLENK